MDKNKVPAMIQELEDCLIQYGVPSNVKKSIQKAIDILREVEGV